MRSLHIPGTPPALSNAWDVGSARAVVDAGLPMVATAGNAICNALGYNDGEGAPGAEMTFAARRMATSVDAPVTVDAEAGYGFAPEGSAACPPARPERAAVISAA
ncbi:isocitrate lyase/phosphoenolpyruvate mutase family protein [Nocardia testacea]|uniref:isocitrate lyase/phosphoenolpyruvate mutase family protein n=1 Tax=Nocardia testacea TaxID=248551 RepID=UPI003C2BEC4E